MLPDWKNIINVAILSKANYIFNAISITVPKHFSQNQKKMILKCIWSHRKPGIAKAILREKSKAGGITLPDFRQHQGIKTADTSNENRHPDQWNRTESPEERAQSPENRRESPHQLIFDKREKKWREDSLFSKWCWKSLKVASKSVKLEHSLLFFFSLLLYTKINSKWLKDFNKT